MKICMLSYSYYESDNRVRRYAEALVQRGDRVDVIAIRQKNHKKHEIIKGVHVYRIQTREKNEKRKIDYLLRILLFLVNSFVLLTYRHSRIHYNLVHVHSVPDFEVFAALIPRMFGAKVILDIHDIVPEFYTGKFNSGKNGMISKTLIWIERLCCSFSHHVFISNDLWRKLLISRSVESAKCTTVLNFPDTSIFIRSKGRSDKSETPFTIIYPGSLNYHQGVDIAVKSMARIIKICPVIQFHIYGVGPLTPKLESLIHDLKLHSNVFIHDILPLEEIALKMSKAHLGIVPKRAEGFGNEAFSTKILEFMIMGVPVVAAETKVDRFYFNDSIIEFFKPGDDQSLSKKILYLFNNKQRRNDLAENALKYAIENSWSEKKFMYYDIVDELCRIEKTEVIGTQKAGL